jgi:TRAP-type transport system small permease protein
MRFPKKPEERLSVACMVVLVFITLGNVLTRYFSDQSFAWTEEISVFLMVVMALAGAAGAAARDGHIRIEYFYDRGSAQRQRSLRIASAVITTLVFLLLALLFARTLMDEIKWAETSVGLGVPRWWFTVWVAPLCMAVAWRAAAVGWKVWKGLHSTPVDETTAP